MKIFKINKFKRKEGKTLYNINYEVIELPITFKSLKLISIRS